MNKETRKNFLNLIQTQKQSNNFIISSLKCDIGIKRLNLRENDNIFICDLLEQKYVYNYFKAIKKFFNNKLPNEIERLKIIEQNIGHTSKFKYFETLKSKLESKSKDNKNFIWDLDEKELYCLIKRIKNNQLINDIKYCDYDKNIERYLKRQLLKKAYFNDLHVLINLDAIYEKELDCINTFLKENKFHYSILRPSFESNEVEDKEINLHEIFLCNNNTKLHLKLNELNKVDYLKLYLLIMKRDRDIIKINAKNFYQILLIDEIDDICEYDEKSIDEALTGILSYLVNYMNIQVVATVNCPKLVETKHGTGYIMEIYQPDQAVQKVSLRKYEKYATASLRDEREFLDEKRKSIDQGLKNEIKTLNREIFKLKQENESLKESFNKTEEENKIIFRDNETILRENENLKKEIEKLSVKNISVSKTENAVVEVSHQNKNTSQLYTEIQDFLKKNKNKSKTLAQLHFESKKSKGLKLSNRFSNVFFKR